ncbi:MAG: lipocalin-like domain-containing protein [Bryobacteraceae bacterium]|jgi:hypothetical protein
MTKPLAIFVVALFAGAAATAFGQAGGNDGVRGRLVGGWRLVSIEQPDAAASTRKIECCGLFVFTRDGHVSVQVMQREPQAQTPATADPYSRAGYEATYGTYVIDETTHTFTIHVEGALASALVGRDLPRVYEFSGKQLIVRSSNPDEHWKATWEHY